MPYLGALSINLGVVYAYVLLVVHDATLQFWRDRRIAALQAHHSPAMMRVSCTPDIPADHLHRAILQPKNRDSLLLREQAVQWLQSLPALQPPPRSGRSRLATGAEPQSAREPSGTFVHRCLHSVRK